MYEANNASATPELNFIGMVDLQGYTELMDAKL
jgi:hypothetical protein